MTSIEAYGGIDTERKGQSERERMAEGGHPKGEDQHRMKIISTEREREREVRNFCVLIALQKRRTISRNEAMALAIAKFN